MVIFVRCNSVWRKILQWNSLNSCNSHKWFFPQITCETKPPTTMAIFPLWSLKWSLVELILKCHFASSETIGDNYATWTELLKRPSKSQVEIPIKFRRQVSEFGLQFDDIDNAHNSQVSLARRSATKLIRERIKQLLRMRPDTFQRLKLHLF